MFVRVISSYCDYMIYIHKFVKNHINPQSIESYLLSVSRPDALKYITNYNQPEIKLYPTRKERYLLYKQLKGKDSPVTLFSCGSEQSDTKKELIIKLNK